MKLCQHRLIDFKAAITRTSNVTRKKGRAIYLSIALFLSLDVSICLSIYACMQPCSPQARRLVSASLHRQLYARMNGSAMSVNLDLYVCSRACMHASAHYSCMNMYLRTYGRTDVSMSTCRAILSPDLSHGDPSKQTPKQYSFRQG